MAITLWWIFDTIVAVMMMIMFPAVGLVHGASAGWIIDSQSHIFWDIHVIALLLMLILAPLLAPLKNYFGVFCNPMYVGVFFIVYSCFNIDMPWNKWGGYWLFYSRFVSFVALVLGIVYIVLSGKFPASLGK